MVSLDKPGRRRYYKNTRTPLCLAVGPLTDQLFMLTVRIAAGRSTGFYGEYVGQNDQTHEEFQNPLSHIRTTSFRRCADRLYTTAS